LSRAKPNIFSGLSAFVGFRFTQPNLPAAGSRA
jgi:hypothetical protein